MNMPVCWCHGVSILEVQCISRKPFNSYSINIWYTKYTATLLLLHIVGQGPAVLAAGAERVVCNFFIFHLSSISNVLFFGRQLNMTEIL